jgi:hypothetical protein
LVVGHHSSGILPSGNAGGPKANITRFAFRPQPHGEVGAHRKWWGMVAKVVDHRIAWKYRATSCTS